MSRKGRIISPMPTGNGAYVLHKMIEAKIQNYRVHGYNPYLTLFPPVLPFLSRSEKPLVVHTTPDYGLFFGRKGVPLVLTVHHLVLDQYMQKYSTLPQRIHYKTDLRWFTKASIRLANMVTAVSHFTAEMAERFPFWHEVWSLDRRKFKMNLLYRFHLLRKVRKAGFEIVIQPSYSRTFLSGDDIVRISGARERIGYVGDFSNIHRFEKRLSNRFYTRLIPTNPKPSMELKRNAEFMCGLGINMKFGLYDLSPAIEGINNLLSNLDNYYILCPAASLSGKQWPINYFSVLADKIYSKTGLVAVICGSSNEQSLAERLVCYVDAPVVNMMGKTNLVELAVLIRDTEFLVGNDTCAIHFAAAVSTPAFCLLGGGHYGRFMPYALEVETKRPIPSPIIHKMDCFGCNWKCRYSVKKGAAFPCIANISANEVFDLLRPALESNDE